jgi:hypothetical protein
MFPAPPRAIEAATYLAGMEQRLSSKGIELIQQMQQ